jgi:hypothetical protein
MTTFKNNPARSFFHLLIACLIAIGLSPLSIQPVSSTPPPIITYTVDSVEDIIVYSGCDDGVDDNDCSLRGAIGLIPDFASELYEIMIPDGEYYLDISTDPVSENLNAEGDLDFPVAEIHLNGESQAGTIIDGNNTDRVLDTIGTYLTINDLTLRNGSLLTGEGGGGGIRVNGGSLVLNRVTITQNDVEGEHYTGDTDRGGGIYETGSASLTITDSIISHNSAVWAGGIDHRDNTPLVMTGSAVSFNTAIRNGGGLILWGGTNTIERTLIMGNTGEVGGGISTNSSGSLTIIDSTIQDNTSTTGGGGLSLWGPTTLTNVSINHNYAAYNGGGLEVWGASGVTNVNLTNVTLINNWTPGSGGGIYVGYLGAASLDHVTLSGNTASSGGYAIQAHYGSVTAISTIISSSSSGSTCGFDNGGSLTSNDFNLSSDTSCNLGSGDLVNQDMHFGDYGYYGGLMSTLRILTGSPAINFGNTADPADRLDQRGVAIIGGRSDSGAFEYIPPSVWLPLVVKPMTY